MDLVSNPFHTLGATMRDDRQRIMDLAEEKSLLSDDDGIRAAAAVLRNPRRRLKAEIGWLPGVGPRRVAEAMEVLERHPTKVRDLRNLPSLARANLLADGLVRAAGRLEKEDLAGWIVELAVVHERIGLDQTATMLNEERSAIRLPAISGLGVVEAELRERRQHYRRAIERALQQLDDISARADVVTTAVEVSHGDHSEESAAPILIDDMVDGFEVTAQAFLKGESERIVAMARGVASAAAEAEGDEQVVGRLVERIEIAVKTWDQVSQPVQLSARRRGTGHDLSGRMAKEIRNAAIGLWADHRLLDAPRRLTALLQEAFAEDEEIAELTRSDMATLAEFAERRSQERVEAAAEGVRALVEDIRSAAAAAEGSERAVDGLVDELEGFVRKRALGSQSVGLAAGMEMRSVAVDLWNEHGLLDAAMRITEILQGAFPNIEGFSERVEEDARVLNGLAEQRAEAMAKEGERAEAWRREITYEAKVGGFWSRRGLSISPEGVEWDGEVYPLERIQAVRWGGTRHSVNYIPTGTTYMVYLATADGGTTIDLKEEEVYSQFVDRLWKAVGVRLVAEMLAGLRTGRHYTVGGVTVSKEGVKWERQGWFGRKRRIECEWSDVVVEEGNGALVLRRYGFPETGVELPYQEVDNVHVLEVAVRVLKEESA